MISVAETSLLSPLGGKPVRTVGGRGWFLASFPVPAADKEPVIPHSHLHRAVAPLMLLDAAGPAISSVSAAAPKHT